MNKTKEYTKLRKFLELADELGFSGAIELEEVRAEKRELYQELREDGFDYRDIKKL